MGWNASCNVGIRNVHNTSDPNQAANLEVLSHDKALLTRLFGGRPPGVALHQWGDRFTSRREVWLGRSNSYAVRSLLGHCVWHRAYTKTVSVTASKVSIAMLSKSYLNPRHYSLLPKRLSYQNDTADLQFPFVRKLHLQQ